MRDNEQRPVRAGGASITSRDPVAERDHVIARLTESFARDELSMEEFERRISLACEARSPAGLRDLVTDLPAAPPSPPPAPPVRIEAVLSSVERAGPRTVPARLEIRAILSSLELDLRGATFEQPVTEIALDLVLGSLELTLPRNCVVENRSGSFLSSFESREAEASVTAPGQPVVVFTGRNLLSSVTVSTP